MRDMILRDVRRFCAEYLDEGPHTKFKEKVNGCGESLTADMETCMLLDEIEFEVEASYVPLKAMVSAAAV